MKRSAVAPEMLQHEGPARVFDCEEDAIAAIKGGRIVAGDVVVIRYEGPKGGPGHARDAQSHLRHRGYGPGLHGGPDHRRPFLRRFQRRFHRTCVHRRPQVGGPIALVEEGDIISIDIDNHRLDVLVSDEELAARKAKWQRPRRPR